MPNQMQVAFVYIADYTRSSVNLLADSFLTDSYVPFGILLNLCR